METQNLYIAIDIGGTHVRIGSTRSLDKPVFERAENFVLTHIFAEDFGRIISIIKDMTNGEEVTAIGVGMPGVLNVDKTALIFATNIPEWVSPEGVTKDIKSLLIENFNGQVYLENDAVTSALAEYFYDGNKGENFIYIIWGTGVGGAVVKTKPTLIAMKINREDYLPEVHLKSYGKHLLERYGRPLGELPESDWDDILTDFGKLLAHISDKFQIKKIVIGGGIALKQKQNIEKLAKKLKGNYRINLQTTKMGDSHTFGLFGASALLLQHAREDANEGRK